MVLSGSPIALHAGETVSFSWQANPPDDYVIGYRLYYGSTSRFDSNGRPKANFFYDYYIDFSDFERCDPGGTGTVCEMLNLDQVECENLSGDFPRCTLYNLQGLLYFAMTAYNTQEESDYTLELSVFLDGEVTPVSPGVQAVLQQIYILLLKEKK